MKQKNVTLRMAAAALAVLMLLAFAPSALGEAVSVNPLIDPQVITAYAETEDEFYNILLLGIDFGSAGFWGSGRKTNLGDCHTDAVMVLSVNMDQEKISLVSLPRDTFIYIPGVDLEEKNANPFILPQNVEKPTPGVHGIYKLNGAINCAGDLEQGVKNVCAAASWLLGGVRIDRYIAVDMNAMIALGDAIGGVDFELDMSYEGSSGMYYHAGAQHLDGQGIMDYLRARRNATVNANDVGRTGRQRRMMAAIFDKILGELRNGRLDILNDISEIIEDKQRNVFKNVEQSDLLELGGEVLQWNREGGLFDSYVLTGPYQWGMTKWLFTFTDQQNRQDVIREVYDLEAEPLPFVSKEYADWLLGSEKSYTLEDGFMNARYIRMARKILDYARSLPALDADQQAATDALSAVYDAAVTAFDRASATLSDADTQALQAAARALVDPAEKTAKAVGYPETVRWNTSLGWWRDPALYDYIINWE